MQLDVVQEHTLTGIKCFEANLGNKAQEELLFDYLNKINEHIGDLSSTVMGSETKHEYFGDALYSIMMLAKKMNVNLAEVMQEKMLRIEDEAALM